MWLHMKSLVLIWNAIEIKNLILFEQENYNQITSLAIKIIVGLQEANKQKLRSNGYIDSRIF